MYDTKPYVDSLKRLVPQARRLCPDTRSLRAGDVFVALPGRHFGVREFVAEASRKACAVVFEDDGAGIKTPCPTVAVPFLSENLGGFAAEFYGHPSRAMHGIAVTGTNGKTTTSHWCGQLLTSLGTLCGAIGTVGSFLGGRPFGQTHLTTPDAVTLQDILENMRSCGAGAFCMEASSIGIEQGRMAGVDIRTAIFTNLTRDHLDYHKTMENYERAKTRLFELDGLENAVVNLDDAAGVRIAQLCARRGLNLIGTTTRGAVAVPGCRLLAARHIRHGKTGVIFDIVFEGETFPAELSILGDFNIANLLGVIGAALCSGFRLAEIAPRLRSLAAPKGRMQQVSVEGAPLAIIDYSHTPDAVEKALSGLVPVARARSGRLVCVIGAGGDRDKGKRPMMARAAAPLCDTLILTSDNPRSEDPLVILSEMQAGAPGAEVIADRRLAIQSAIARSKPEDIILIAGKGHEDYQEIKGVKHPFDDATEAKSAMLVKCPPQGTKMDLETLALHMEGAKLLGANTVFSSVATDSRRAREGCLYFAMKGGNFDGHDFVEKAREAGAAAAVVERPCPSVIPQVLVGDARKALLESAAYWRSLMDCPVIAVTGSNGKTTTTQMTASILKEAFGSGAHATQGNFNNDIGVPLTLWAMTPETKAAVIEAGMNHPGEMALLARCVSPTAAVVTNAQREHLEFIGTVENSARENGEMIKALRTGGCAVFPADDPCAPIWAGCAKGKIVRTFAESGQSDISGTLKPSGEKTVMHISTPEGAIRCVTHTSGRHNLRDAMAAAGAALAIGVPLEAVRRGLEAFRPVKGRGARLEGAHMTVIDEAYNANPDSACAALDVLSGEKAPRLFVFGDMGELGKYSEEGHRAVGEYAAQKKIEAVVTLGAMAKIAAGAYKKNYPAGLAVSFDDREAFNAWLRNNAGSYRSVLLKASHYMRFDETLDLLQGAFGLHGRNQ